MTSASRASDPFAPSGTGPANHSGPPTAESPWPVRLVSRKIGEWLGRLGTVWVEGQLAQINRRSGTVFLTLRDPSVDMSLPVTCPRLLFDEVQPPPTEGARVIVLAKPDFYPVRGTLSLRATAIRPVGIGELLARLARLKAALAAEGLFAAERKRRLPFLPSMVGLVTGRASAAERDVISNARRRWPAVRFRISAVPVQGSGAAAAIVGAVLALDADPEVDVIVIARGGGSTEDLLPFSDEGLCRAVFACRTPVVSAIGHEPDTPLLDHVADVRCSTPTDAAKRVVPDLAEELAGLATARTRLRRCVTDRVERESQWLRSVRSRPVFATPLVLIDRQADEVSALLRRARRTMSHRLDGATGELRHTRARVAALSPAATLQRGYAVVQRANGEVVRHPAQVAVDETVRVRLAGGELDAAVRKTGEPYGPSADGRPNQIDPVVPEA